MTELELKPCPRCGGKGMINRDEPLSIDQQLQYAVNRIRKMRRDRDMSQLDFAIEADISQNFLACIEKGQKKPSLETLLKIASAFGVSPRSFFPEEVSDE